MEIKSYRESLQFNLEASARIVQEAISMQFKTNNFGISYDEFIILDEILHNPGIIQNELAKEILKGRAYTGRFLVQLEEKGFIERKKAVKAKCQTVIKNYITTNGKNIHSKGIKIVQDFIDPIIFKEKNINYILEFLKNFRNIAKEKYNVKFN